MAALLNRRRVNALVTLIVAAVVVILLLLLFSPSEFKDKSLMELLVELRTEYEAPGLSITKAAQTLKSPEAAFEFVRDRVRYSPYQGNLQEPADVLRTRVANVQDRALLLFALLKEMGIKATLVTTTMRDLPEDVAPEPGLKVIARSGIVAEIGRRIGYDFSLEASEISQIETQLASYAQKTGEQIEQAENVIIELADFSYPSYLSPAWKNYDRNWVWLEAGKENEARIFDPSFPGTKRPEDWMVDKYEATAAATGEIRLFVENRDGLREQLLDWDGAPFGKDITLTFLPTQNAIAVLDGPFKPERVEMWTPVLQVGAQTIFGEPVSVNGDHIGFVPGPAPYSPKDGLRSDLAITRADLVRIDARNFPTVQALIDVKTSGERAWFARDFQLSENGITRPVRIKSLALDPRPVVAVSDVSWSMEDDDRLAQSQIALKALVAALGSRTPFALVSFAGDAVTELGLAPLGDGAGARSIIEGLQFRSNTELLAGINAGIDLLGDQDGTIIMLTDGQDDAVSGDLEVTLSRLANSNVKVIAIGLGPEPDETLMRRFADVSGGKYVRFTKGDDLTSIYSALGSSLSGLLAIEYKTDLVLDPQSADVPSDAIGVTNGAISQESTTASPLASVPGDLRQISLNIAGFNKGELTGSYIAPDKPGFSPRLVLEILSGQAEARQTVTRTIAPLDGPISGWKLAGLNQIYFDLGQPHPSVVFAGYLTNWINALLLNLDDPDLQQKLGLDPLSGSNRMSFQNAITLGGFRTLANAPGDGTIIYSPGPNIYLERRQFGPGDGKPVEINSFDIMQVQGRGIEELARTNKAMVLEIAATFAEGAMVGGADSVSPLLANAGELTLLSPGDPAPDNWPDELSRQAMLRQSADTSWIYSPRVANIAWEINSSNRGFKAYVDNSGLIAKGASIARIAQQFDQIDKMYAAYAALGSWGGKAAGVAGISPLIAMIAAFKREENKLWCYSTIMMGYVNQSIDNPDATLNKSPQEAVASAASLCKMDYSPDQFGERAVWAAATAGAKSWSQNRFKDFMRSQGFGLGATIVDAYSNGGKTGSIGSAFLPLTPGFHSLMSEVVQAGGQN